MSHFWCFFVLFLTWQYHFWSKSLRCHFIGIPESPKHFESVSGISTMESTELVLCCKTFSSITPHSRLWSGWFKQLKKRFDKRSKILVPLNCPNFWRWWRLQTCDGKHHELNVVLRIHENLGFVGCGNVTTICRLHHGGSWYDHGCCISVAQDSQKISLKLPQPRVLGGRAY